MFFSIGLDIMCLSCKKDVGCTKLHKHAKPFQRDRNCITLYGDNFVPKLQDV